jgi:hypothetical protein
MDDNPFRAPMEMHPFSTPVSSGQFERDDMQLIVRSGAVLPPFCVKTGEPVSAEGMVTKTITWSPIWVVVIFLASPLIGLIVYFIVRKKCEITYGLSAAMKSKYWTRRLIALVVALGCFAGIFVAGNMDYLMVAILSGVGAVMALAVAVVGTAPLSAANHVNGRFWVKGCSRGFLSRIE